VNPYGIGNASDPFEVTFDPDTRPIGRQRGIMMS
jgi:hypothetical protein